MPLYEYACEKCSHKTTKLKSIESRDEPLECSKCGSTTVRVYSIPAEPQFKGSGWTPKFYGNKDE